MTGVLFAIQVVGIEGLNLACLGRHRGLSRPVQFGGVLCGAALSPARARRQRDPSPDPGALGGSMTDMGIDEDFINSIRGKVTEGTSALFMVTGDAVEDRVVEAMKQVQV